MPFSIRVAPAHLLVSGLGFRSQQHILSVGLQQQHRQSDLSILHRNVKWLAVINHRLIPQFLCDLTRYFSAITASTRIFGERKPGLSVAGPSSMFGLSPLLLSFLGVKCFSSPDGSFNSSGYLAFLAILTLIVNLVGSIGLPRKDELTYVLSSYDPDERAPLLQTSPPLPNHSLHPKPPARAVRDPEGIFSFLASPTVWFLGMAALLSVGPAEMTIASIGAVADAKNPGLGTVFKARQVQLISITNTFSRLLSGWLSDRFCHSSWGSRLLLWGLACFCYAMACFSVAINGSIVWVLSAVTGSCYGVVCTLASVSNPYSRVYWFLAMRLC
jgi:hypothetical protein